MSDLTRARIVGSILSMTPGFDDDARLGDVVSILHPLVHVPVVNLIIILAGLPVAAGVGGWLLAGWEPPAMSRQPLE